MPSDIKTLNLNMFSTWIKKIELLSIILDKKAVTRQGYYDDELPLIKNFCKQNKLYLVKSEFKIKTIEDNYSEKGIAVSKKEEGAMTFLYISKDELLAYKASYFDITHDHENLGILLGYPKCCRTFFKENYEERSKLDNNYEVPMLNNSKKTNYIFYNNIFKRDSGITLLSHFPCYLDCNESQKIAKSNMSILNQFFPKTAKHFSTVLRTNFKAHERIIKFH